MLADVSVVDRCLEISTPSLEVLEGGSSVITTVTYRRERQWNFELGLDLELVRK